MSWGSLGSVLIVLLIVFIVGNVWFHFVESILTWLKRLFFRNNKPTAWHTLPPEPEQKEKE